MPQRKNEKTIGAFTVARYKQLHVCTNRCVGKEGRNFGRDHITVAGWPLGWFCPTCVKELTAAWQSARTNWETDEPEVELPNRFSDYLAAA